MGNRTVAVLATSPAISIPLDTPLLRNGSWGSVNLDTPTTPHLLRPLRDEVNCLAGSQCTPREAHPPEPYKYRFA